MAVEGALSPLFGGWGFSPGLNLEAMDSLSSAVRRERYLRAGLSALFLLLASSLFLVARLRRKRFELETAFAERNRAEAENVKLQARLHQANKMESVGRLAGGIAHDFNNLLTVINGYSGLLLNQSAPEDPARTMVEAIYHAGERATALTSQLLALSRKQTIKPRPMDLNAVVKDIHQVLDRVIGEDIEVHTKVDQQLGQLVADPDQVHQVLMNLVINARDAMPHGGTLTIEAENVQIDEATAAAQQDATPGRFVMLRVSDTGVGMDQATCEHVFEPFFTTKESGKGTGLGLSTVYGIVTQSGGWIDVYSELNKGSSFSVYLPRTDAVVSPEKPVTEPGTRHGGETVLLVEDQDFVRRFARRVLENYGYKVLEAEGADEACALVERHSG
jgi:signal transduction histidine kinase